MDECLVLLSGGIDSAVSLWWARENFKNVYTLTFYYGQRHSIEVEFARELSRLAGVKRHFEMELNFFEIFNSSSLLNENLRVPKGPYPPRGVISTYVPMRNSIFGVIACAVMENLEICNLVVGVHSSDVPNYPDTRPEWASALEVLLNTGSKLAFETGRRIRVITPLLGLIKPEIVKLGLSLNVPFEHTWSCYSPNGRYPCGECPACIQRREAFESLGLKDPLEKKEV